MNGTVEAPANLLSGILLQLLLKGPASTPHHLFLAPVGALFGPERPDGHAEQDMRPITEQPPQREQKHIWQSARSYASGIPVEAVGAGQ